MLYMKKGILIIAGLICSLAAAADWFDNPSLFVEVVDSYSRELIMGARADLLRPDSTLIKSYWADTENARFSNRKVNLVIDSIPRTGALLYVTHEGYYPAYVTIPKLGPREHWADIHPIRLNRIPFFKPKELNEVTVTASRVKMVVKGDTIVYNADAFSLAQGSMLDGLIDQLPGAELKSDGRIYINGKFVSELLVNGDNFFKGDPKIALENQPAYMVKDIRVYHRNDPREKKELRELPLVMDVALKKQYQTGWIANAEAGYGTSNRYVGRVFGMLFTRDSRLAIVGNINNTNDDRKPGQTDNWNPNWQNAGRAEVITGGLDYTWNSRLRQWKVEANLMAKHKKSDIESTTLSERYLEGGNLLGRAISSAESRQIRISSDNSVQLTIPRFELYIMPKFSYERTKSNESSESSNETSAGTLLNSLDETGSFYNKRWNLGLSASGRWQLPMVPEHLNYSTSVKWYKSNRETTRLRELIFSEQPNLTDISAPQEFLPEKKLTAKAMVSYGTPSYEPSRFIFAGFTVKYNYEYRNLHNTRDYYLRQIDEADVLPSVAEAAGHAGFIASNSYDYVLTESDHNLDLELRNFFPHLYKRQYRPNVAIGADLNYVPGNISYTQSGQTYTAKRNPFFVNPKVSLDIEDIGWATYRYYSTLPELRNLLDVTDAANPLYIYLGNPALKTTRVHEVYLRLYDLLRWGPGIEVTYKKYINMVAQSADYDMTTGITTYKPVNVNGNWDITANITSPYRWSRLEKWRPEVNIKVMYQNSADFINMTLSTVRNFNLGGKAKLTYKILDGMEITANGNAEWRKVTSPMSGFEPISAVDFDYGIIFRATKLPWNMSFSTDLMMHSRRGYNDSRLNTNDLVWNARLAKSILQGNLTFAIDGFDILGQLSNVRLTMNSQGRTEARYNTLPRYAMLHVIYRLNIQPKKK